MATKHDKLLPGESMIVDHFHCDKSSRLESSTGVGEKLHWRVHMGRCSYRNSVHPSTHNLRHAQNSTCQEDLQGLDMLVMDIVHLLSKSTNNIFCTIGKYNVLHFLVDTITMDQPNVPEVYL